MKIKLVQPGWEALTGLFGGVDFADGVSVNDVADADARRLANIVSIERLDGSNPSSSQAVLDSQSTSMQVVPERTVAAPVTAYTQEGLEAIASKKGIKGLREVSEPLGVKASGIAELIELILKAQAVKAATESNGEQAPSQAADKPAAE
jgi:hypothetical protein